MIIYSCCSSVAQGEGGARSTALARLVGRKADRRRDVLLPQDGVNAVYLVIRMLFLAFFFPLAELVFSAAVLLGQLAPRTARSAGLGTAASHASHLLNLAVWLPNQKSKPWLQWEVNPCRREHCTSTEQLSHSWDFSRSLALASSCCSSLTSAFFFFH